VSESIAVAAPAKLNLFLHVGDRRADGYHDLESLVAFTTCGDEIVLEAADDIALSLSGPFGAELATGSEENLVLRAARALARSTGAQCGVRIALTKNLPVASGMGGGSADAAAVLRGLVRLWQIEPDRDLLHGIAASLGADVPACLDCVACWMEGKGERVHALPALPNAGVLLVNPGIPLPTAQVFAAIRSRRGLGVTRPEHAFKDARALVGFLQTTTNDLEAPARVLAPVIGDVLRDLADLPDILLARMSGSGATCFGLFEDERSVRTAGVLLRALHPEWWVSETTFHYTSN